MSDNPLDYIYDEDTSSKSDFNKITNELHIVTTGEPNDFNVIVPKYMPYFRESMEITHVPTGKKLIRGQDWMPGHFFSSATFETESISGGIYGSILIMDRSLRGEFRLDEYQTLGGEWTLGNDKVLEILSRRMTDPRTMTYEQVSGKPNVFPPTGHNHPIEDWTGFSEAVVSILDIAKAIREKTQSWLDNPPILMSEYYLKGESDDSAEAIANRVFGERIGPTIDLVNSSLNTLTNELNNAINDRYSKVQSDARYYQKAEIYTKSELDNLLSGNLVNYYTKSDSDTRYYNKTEVYTKVEADNRFAYRTTKVQAGTGLLGGGTLAANRTLEVKYGTTAGTAVEGNETRIVNAVQNTRKVITKNGLKGGNNLEGDITLEPVYGTEVNTVMQGNDSRVVNAVQNTRSISVGTGLTGGGTLNGDRTISLVDIAAYSTTVGALAYNGTTRVAGKLYGGTTNPNGTTRLNYDGVFHATSFSGSMAASNLTGTIAGERLPAPTNTKLGGLKTRLSGKTLYMRSDDYNA